MASRDALKRKAAEAALAYVKPGMVLGLGTGSTARFFLEGVARLVREGMDLKGVPTSFATADAAKDLGIPLTSLEERPSVDLCVDGAVGHGLFLGIADAVLVASDEGVRTLRPTRTS